MSIIPNTNIAIDFFTLPKKDPGKKYIYFLTHMHSDHYYGLSSNWDYGPIYCSEITKKNSIDMDSPTKIYLDEAKELSVEVTFLNANHCPGSILILIKGYMGTYLHTGDMRFSPSMFKEHKFLYPEELQTKDFKGCSVHVDELIFDNTYCDPIFNFPDRDDAFENIKKIISENENKRIYIAVDSIGKEEMMICLSEYFKTKIVVNEDRYKIIQAINFKLDYFTTRMEEGWIEVIRKGEIEQRISEKSVPSICITATGWANSTTYISPDKKKYIVPYSLHSNFNELEQFVRSIMPGALKCVVRHQGKSEKVRTIHEFSSYMITLQNLKQRGFDFFCQNYVSSAKFSKEYLEHQDPNKKIDILGKLNLLDDAKNQQIFESSFAEYLNPKKKNKDWQLKKAAKGNLKIEDLLKAKKKK